MESHNAFLTFLSNDLYLRRAWRWLYNSRNRLL